MTDTMLLRGTAESMQTELEQKRDKKWHTGNEYQRTIYKIERLKIFKQYINLKKEFTPEW